MLNFIATLPYRNWHINASSNAPKPKWPRNALMRFFRRLSNLCTLPTIRIHFDTLRYVTIHFDTFRYTLIHFDTFRYTLIRYDTLRYVTIHFDTVWYSLIQFDTVWYIWQCADVLPLHRFPVDSIARMLIFVRRIDCVRVWFSIIRTIQNQIRNGNKSVRLTKTAEYAPTWIPKSCFHLIGEDVLLVIW